MTLVSPTQVADGAPRVASNINTPVNEIAAVVNGNIDDSNIKAAAGIASSKIAFNSTPGLVVQIAATNYSAVATGSTMIPNDDTIPQITEGNEFMTQIITPKSATNRLFIEAKISLAVSSNASRIAALFQDATANALAVQATYVGNFTDPVTLYITHDMVAGTTSSTTFRVRGGADVAGTWTMNGQAGARKFGGVTLSSIKITEYMA